MATDFAYALMLIPVLVGIAALIVIAVLGSRVPIGTGFVGLGRRRIALGYLGALAATFVYSFIEAVQLMLWKADQGHISASEAKSRFLGATLYMFVLYAPFVVAFLSFAGLPILSAMRRFGVATIAGVAVIGILIAVVLAALVFVFPYNLWCGSHAWQCGTETFASALALSVPVALGFAVAAGLPWPGRLRRRPADVA